jgi:hypothetical protein
MPMTVERSRIALLTGFAALALAGGTSSRARAQSLPEVTVYKSPT